MDISPHPESVSGTLQSSYRCRSSHTPLRRSDQDTYHRSPCRAEETWVWFVRSGTALQPGQPVSAPVVQCPWAEVNQNNQEEEKRERKRAFYLFRADVHAPVHRHVLDERRERESHLDVVRLVKTAFEEGTAILKTPKKVLQWMSEHFAVGSGVVISGPNVLHIDIYVGATQSQFPCRNHQKGLLK